MLEQNTKFFKLFESEDDYCALFVCHKDTPIPTAEEIVKSNPLSPFCKDDKVVEITVAEFLALQNDLLASLVDSTEDMIEWSPNFGQLKTWEFWMGDIENDEN